MTRHHHHHEELLMRMNEDGVMEDDAVGAGSDHKA
jgi:hypothetical protein